MRSSPEIKKAIAIQQVPFSFPNAKSYTIYDIIFEKLFSLFLRPPFQISNDPASVEFENAARMSSLSGYKHAGSLKAAESASERRNEQLG